MRGRGYIKGIENAAGFRQIAEHAALRQRGTANQGRGDDDLVLVGTVFVLVKVHDREGVGVFQMSLADRLNIRDGAAGSRRAASYVETEHILDPVRMRDEARGEEVI
jgi:hypothetical protein